MDTDFTVGTLDDGASATIGLSESSGPLSLSYNSTTFLGGGSAFTSEKAYCVASPMRVMDGAACKLTLALDDLHTRSGDSRARGPAVHLDRLLAQSPTVQLHLGRQRRRVQAQHLLLVRAAKHATAALLQAMMPRCSTLAAHGVP